MLSKEEILIDKIITQDKTVLKQVFSEYSSQYQHFLVEAITDTTIDTEYWLKLINWIGETEAHSYNIRPLYLTQKKIANKKQAENIIRDAAIKEFYYRYHSLFLRKLVKMILDTPKFENVIQLYKEKEFTSSQSKYNLAYKWTMYNISMLMDKAETPLDTSVEELTFKRLLFDTMNFNYYSYSKKMKLLGVKYDIQFGNKVIIWCIIRMLDIFKKYNIPTIFGTVPMHSDYEKFLVNRLPGLLIDPESNDLDIICLLHYQTPNEDSRKEVTRLLNLPDYNMFEVDMERFM